MNNAKYIAEKIINRYVYNHETIMELARAYLELEKKLQFTNNNWPHEKQLHEEITNLSEANAKFKEENAELKFYKEQYQSIAGKANLKHLIDSKELFQSENEKLKAENKELKGLADFDAFSRENFNNINAKQSSEIIKLKEEIKNYKNVSNLLADYNYAVAIENEKLKKSREVLRKAAEFYGDKSHWEYWHNHDVGTFTEWNTLRQEVHCGGKKAREAIKEDDEIMGGN